MSTHLKCVENLKSSLKNIAYKESVFIACLLPLALIAFLFLGEGIGNIVWIALIIVIAVAAIRNYRTRTAFNDKNFVTEAHEKMENVISDELLSLAKLRG